MSTIDGGKEERKGSGPSTGPATDFSLYSTKAETHAAVKRLTDLPEEVRKRVVAVGMDTAETCRSGTFFQMDHSVLLSSASRDGLEIMSTTEALERHGWLSEYWWRSLNPDMDEYTAEAERNRHHGYFLRALPGAKVEFPLQACLFMTKDGLAQNVHNIIIAEEESELHIIAGCATAQGVRSGLHIGVSEFFVKKRAKVTFTMIHQWAEDMVVRPRSAAVVEEEGTFMSNYICMKPVRSLQMYPVTYCKGERSLTRYNTVLVCPGGSDMDVGARVFLSAPGSRAEVVTRAVSKGGRVTARGHLVGQVAGVKAHLECRGLIFSERGTIHAIPELEGRTGGVDLSHEAAVGKIAEEEIQYLMARGLSSEEAAAAIVRGFLDIEIKGLPSRLEEEVKKVLRKEEGEHLL